MIAALYVETGGAYFGLEGVEPWDEVRDARYYTGPHPVVAHPPCDRWHQLSAVNAKRWGYRINDDEGCFAAALEAVRKFGGVLEHPAESRAFKFHRIPEPQPGGWQRGLKFIGIEREERYFDLACRRIEQACRQADLFVAPPSAPEQQDSLFEVGG